MKHLKTLWSMVDGHKTDLLVLVGIALWLGMIVGWWTYADIQRLIEIDALLVAAALRDGMRK